MLLMLSENTDSPLRGLGTDILTNMQTRYAESVPTHGPISCSRFKPACQVRLYGVQRKRMPRHRSISRSGICGSGKHIGRAHRDGAIAQIVTAEIFKPKDGIVCLISLQRR
jgi:hypothetical protein